MLLGKCSYNVLFLQKIEQNHRVSLTDFRVAALIYSMEKILPRSITYHVAAYASILQVRQRMLAQLVSHSGGTPQVLSSTPRGSEFQPEGKKIPSLAPVPMHWCGRPRSAWGPLHGPGRVPMGYGPQCQGGARVRGFSRSGKPRLLLESQYRWGGLSPPGRVLFVKIFSNLNPLLCKPTCCQSCSSSEPACYHYWFSPNKWKCAPQK